MNFDHFLLLSLKLLAIIFLVLLNGFFVAAEFALVKVRASQLRPLAKKGGWRVKIALRASKRLDAALSATQLGITLASLGLGWIDSNPDFRGSQGQDFTFNILTSAGFCYKIDNHWKIDAGVLYEHLSNGGQTDPNPSLNLLGPQVGLTYTF